MISNRPRPTTLIPPRSNGTQEAATAVYKLLMMGKRMSETCWAAFERLAINLRYWCIWLADLFEWLLLLLLYHHYSHPHHHHHHQNRHHPKHLSWINELIRWFIDKLIVISTQVTTEYRILHAVSVLLPARKPTVFLQRRQLITLS